MNLIVDIGNSSTKVALLERGKKLSVSRMNELDWEEMERVLSGFRIEKAIVSSVINIPASFTELLYSKLPYVHMLSYRSQLPFTIEYDTPQTLGTDRIAGVAGAFNLFPDSALMVIDAGTAITYDFLTDGIFRGGNISPGLSTRLRSLHEFTGKLPHVAIRDNFTNPGRNTADAILAGVITGITYEINEYIRTFKKKHSDCKVIMTGGDGGFINGKIEHQLTYMPDIVIDGLNYILEYNAA
jgi:type III pantothenate kinase